VRLAFSPCPNDTFVFHAWTHGLLDGAPTTEVTYADIDVTNTAAERGEFDVVKVSYAALPWLMDRYTLLPCGGAVGRGCGPLVLTGGDTPTGLAGRRVAVPSERSTAYLLFRLWTSGQQPAAIDVFNASAQDRPGVRYGCVVTQARGAGLRSFLSAGLSPYAHASHALYVCISQLAARLPKDRLPTLDQPQQAALRQAFGALPRRRDNDGIVPTLSQVWGQVVCGVWADHLDVIGHFHNPTHVPPHFDWLTSGSGHTRQDFLATWDAIARFMFQPGDGGSDA